MKRGLVVITSMLLLGSCDGSGKTRTVTCQPSITAPARAQTSNKSVRVLWDISKTMRLFVGGPQQPRAIDAFVETLDSAVLVAAGAREVKHFAVGDAIIEASNATRALRPDASWTALHDAAAQAAGQLAAGKAGAIIFVSDMKLEIPAKQIAQGGTVCGNISVPSTPRAGALFGRCLSLGFSAGPALNDVFSQAFRSCSGGQCIYVLLIATDVDLGRNIASQMQATWAPRVEQLKSYRIADTLASQQHLPDAAQCTWNEGRSGGLRLSQTARPGECRVRCDGNDPVRIHCSVAAPRQDVWLRTSLASASTVPEARRFTATVNVAKDAFDLSIKCPRSSNWVNTGSRVLYDWVASVPEEISTDADTRRLFQSTADAILERVPKREMTVTLAIR